MWDRAENRRKRCYIHTGRAVVLAAVCSVSTASLYGETITVTNTSTESMIYGTNGWRTPTGSGTYTFETVPGNIELTDRIYDGGTHALVKNGPGTLLTNVNHVLLGTTYLNEGTFQIGPSSTFAAKATRLGSVAGKSGTLSLDGGTWSTSSAELLVGYLGGGSIQLTNGGKLNSGMSTLGQELGSAGTAGIHQGSIWTVGVGKSLVIGKAGSGEVSVTTGGSVKALGPTTTLGLLAGSQGIVTVDGAGSSFAATSLLQVGGAGNGSALVTNGGRLSSTGTVLVKGTGALSLDGGTLQAADLFTEAGATISLLAGGGVLEITGVSSDISSPITGPGLLTKSGTGKLRLSGSGGPAGGVLLKDGALVLGGNSAMDNSRLTFAGGTLEYGQSVTADVSGMIAPLAAGENARVDTGGNTVSFATSLAGEGGLVKLGNGTLALDASSGYTGGTHVAGGTLLARTVPSLPQSGTISVDSATLAVSTGAGRWSATDIEGLINRAQFTGDAKFGFDVEADQTFTYATAISGTTGIAKLGSGKLVLAGGNTYAGNTSVRQGTLVLGSSSALGNGKSVEMAGGTLDVAGHSIDLRNLYGSSGQITTSAATDSVVTFVGSSTPSIFGGTLTDASAQGSGRVGLHVAGGDLTLSGSNTYSGGTRVSGGTLIASSPAALPGYSTPNSISVENGGTLELPIPSEPQWSSAQVSSLLESAQWAPDSRFAANVESFTTWDTPMHFSAGLVKKGAGTLTLSAANTFGGPLVVQAGKVDASNVGLGAGSTAPIELKGSRLRFSGVVTTARPIAITGATTIETTYYDVQLLGNITGTGSLNLLMEDGVVELAGENSFSGGLTLSGGGVRVTRASSLGSGPISIAVGPHGTMSPWIWYDGESDDVISAPITTVPTVGIGVTSNTLRIGGAISGAGGIQKGGAGTLVLQGTNTYAGSTIVNGGILNLAEGASATGYELHIGGGTTSVGATSIQGNWTTASSAEVGVYGSGTLTVAGGGNLSTDHGFVAFYSGSRGDATVTGAGSTWTTRKSLFVGGTAVGNGGQGSVMVRDDGLVQVTDTLQLWDRGTLNIDGGEVVAKRILGRASSTIQIGSAGGSISVTDASTIAGPISGTGALQKRGTGKLTLSAPGTLTGSIHVGEGTLAMAGDYTTLFPSLPSMSVAKSGTLDVTGLRNGELVMQQGQDLTVDGSLLGKVRGTGTVGGSGQMSELTITTGGVLSPGNSIGTIDIMGDLNLAGTLLAELDPASAGQTADLVRVAGTFDQNGSMLSLALLSAPSLGQVFPILQLGDAGSPGYFASLPEGAITYATFNGTSYGFAVSYSANLDGGSVSNDVTLTTVPEPAAIGALGLGVGALLRRRRERR